MKNEDIVLLGIAAAAIFVLFDIRNRKRHFYLPAALDAEIAIQNAVRDGKIPLQTGNEQLRMMRAGEITPEYLIDVMSKIQ